jgi:hypothetical protein
LVPLEVVTKTLAVPAVPAGVTQVRVVALVTTTSVAAVPPMVTPVAPVKLVPVMVTLVTPAVLPEVGEMDVTVGALKADRLVTRVRRMLRTVFMWRMAGTRED